MNPSRRPLLSPRALVRELVFIIRMRAAQPRFLRHHISWRRHEAEGNRYLDAMAAEVEYRATLCERNAAARISVTTLRTAITLPIAGYLYGPASLIVIDVVFTWS